MKQIGHRVPVTIRSKLLYSFLIMIGIFTLVSLFSYYSEQHMLNRFNVLLSNNLKLKEFRTNIDNVVTSLEQYLISRNFNMLRQYYQYSQEVDADYPNLKTIEPSLDNYLLLENIRNMTRSFLKQTEIAVQAKRARDSSGYHKAFLEVVRYGTNINWAIDRLITQQLEESSRQYLYISKRLATIQRLGLLLIIGALIFSVITTLWISFRLTTPLQRLAKAAQIISKGNFSAEPLQVTTEDEIGVVTRAFNEMTQNISKLFAEIKLQSDLAQRLQEQELQNLSMKNVLREAELQALQSQINPHFLFNMLNAGVQLAIIESADQTAEYIDKVSNLLRYNLRQLDKPVSLAEEFNHLQTYFFILKSRYGEERFTFETELDPNIASFQIPLLTLQPIVENALIHGIENLESGGKIQVQAFLEAGQVIIRVHDNGRGIPPDTLQQIKEGQSKTGHTTGLGLQNVKERLRIFFGESDLMWIDSKPNDGTTIELRLPTYGRYEREIDDACTGCR